MAVNVGEVEHWVTITAHTKLGGELICVASWDEMTFDQRLKWDWYFKYRAALMQVQNPKAYVNMSWGHNEAKGRTVKNNTENRLIAAKRKLTEYRNKLNRYVDQWNCTLQIFPIEDDPSYKFAIKKIKEKECLVNNLQIEVEKLKQNQSEIHKENSNA